MLKLHKIKLKEDHRDTLRSINNLANWYNEARQRLEALQLTKMILRLRKNKLEEDHPDTLRSMNNLAIWYSEARRRLEAL